MNPGIRPAVPNPATPAPQPPSAEYPPLDERYFSDASEPEMPRSGLPASVQSLAVTVVIAIFVIAFIVQAFQIPSESMENTLLIGDYLLVDKVHYSGDGLWGRILPYGEIRRGDIIVFRYPVHPQQHFVKRVIGLPGDRVRIVNKRVFVNDAPVREKYVVYRSGAHDPYRDDFPNTKALNTNVDPRWWLQMRSLVSGRELVVPADSYFVLGDNRDESLDSRYWGFVPRESIIGRPLLIYWSLRTAPGQKAATQMGDKILRVAYNLTHLFQQTRWDRTLRVIR
ncbi:MAG: signal peptidase I [Terriglobales bacterium]